MTFLERRRLLLTQNKSILPPQYQQVEYIENTGTQYIDTNLIFTDIKNTDVGISIEASEFENAGATTGRVFGGSTGTRDYIGARYGTANSSALEVYKRTEHSSPESITIPSITNSKIEFIGDSVYCDGVKKGVFNNLDNNKTSQRSCLLFAYNTTSIQICKIPIKLKYFWVKVSGVLVLDLIPCYIKSDNTIGMYDLINDVFYKNAGTGEFIVGDDA